MPRILILLLSTVLLFSCKKTDKKDAGSTPKTVYYRVKMVDKNGHVTYSQVKTVLEK